MTAFDHAIQAVLAHEGGYVDHPNDPGSRTKYGISQRSYPTLDIKLLTIAKAMEIYQRDYWEPIAGDKLPPAVALVVFDCGVNQGIPRACRLLQRILGVEQDGIIGDQTVQACQARLAADLVSEYQAQRVMFYAALETWHTFGLGWMRRLLSIHAAALKLAL